MAAMTRKKPIRVLIIDGDVQHARELKSGLAVYGVDAMVISCAENVVLELEKDSFDAVVLDTRPSDLRGSDLLVKIRRARPTLEVIVYTNYLTIDSAVRYMKQGAYDLIIRPCNLKKLADAICRAHENRRPAEPQRESASKECSKASRAADCMVGESKEMKRVRGLIGLVAPSRAPVLVLGETGTGKELVARAIHSQSPRHKYPLVTVNASVLQENILESELFGYRKGAFTDARSDKKGLLEIADNGTCFIDEIADMGLSIQAKLLRVVESGAFMKLGDTRETKVDVRFLFATNKDLMSSVENGGFRKDLFYRINAFPIHLPSLKVREGDIALLSNYFLKRVSQKEKNLSAKAVKLLAAYDWPGNVRELANVIQRATLVSGTRKTIVPDDLPENIICTVASRSTRKKPAPMREMSLAQGKREYVAKILDFTEGNKAKAARLLGIGRSTLYRNLVFRSG